MNLYKIRITAIIAILAVVVGFVACEKEITIDTSNIATTIVVEGRIEQGQSPLVLITKGASYFSPVADSANEVHKYQVNGGKVTVSVDGKDYVLTETLIFGFSGYTSKALVGEVGKTYSLKVEVEGKVLTAITIIPQPVKLDSVRFKVSDDEERNPNDSLGTLKCYLADPAGLGNYYRYFIKRIKTYKKDNEDKDYTVNDNSVFSDAIVDGIRFDFEMRRPASRMESNNGDNPDAKQNKERGLFRKGDTIVLKWCSIDKAHYDFWRTLEQSNHSQGNPFASPTTIKSNINGGLGIWGGYAASYDTIFAK